jgi:hypothetical protein
VDDILDVTLLVAETLERLEVPYVVGGSLASSFHGIPRATIDAAGAGARTAFRID